MKRGGSYVIEHRHEEAECDGCGMPLLVGDRVHTSDVEVVPETACSRTCLAVCVDD